MKIDRLISIIMVLLERNKVSATKLAEMFEVTPRTIYRDIETINLAGIPIIAYPGVKGGISIMDEYKIEKGIFTISDISSLLTGLGNIHATVSNEEILNTMAKIKGLIPDFSPREFNYETRDVSFRGDRKSITIKLLIDNSLCDIMAETCGEDKIEPSENNKFIVYFPFTEEDSHYNMLLQFGNKCEVLEPEYIRLELIQRIKDLLCVYEKE